MGVSAEMLDHGIVVSRDVMPRDAPIPHDSAPISEAASSDFGFAVVRPRPTYGSRVDVETGDSAGKTDVTAHVDQGMDRGSAKTPEKQLELVSPDGAPIQPPQHQISRTASSNRPTAIATITADEEDANVSNAGPILAGVKLVAKL